MFRLFQSSRVTRSRSDVGDTKPDAADRSVKASSLKRKRPETESDEKRETRVSSPSSPVGELQSLIQTDLTTSESQGQHDIIYFVTPYFYSYGKICCPDAYNNQNRLYLDSQILKDTRQKTRVLLKNQRIRRWRKKSQRRNP